MVLSEKLFKGFHNQPIITFSFKFIVRYEWMLSHLRKINFNEKFEFLISVMRSSVVLSLDDGIVEEVDKNVQFLINFFKCIFYMQKWLGIVLMKKKWM